jgi:hypothetical protein
MRTTTSIPDNGLHDFDFIHGCWHIENYEIAEILDHKCSDWLSFDSKSEVRPILDGFSNAAVYSAVPPDGDPFEGFTLRAFDPVTAVWRIWSATTTRPEHLDPPVVGRFNAGVGWQTNWTMRLSRLQSW